MGLFQLLYIKKSIKWIALKKSDVLITQRQQFHFPVPTLSPHGLIYLNFKVVSSGLKNGA